MLTKKEREKMDLDNFAQKCASSIKNASPTALVLNPPNEWSENQLEEAFVKSVEAVAYLCDQIDDNDIERFVRAGDGSFKKATQGILRDHSFDPKLRRQNCAVLLRKSVCTGDLTAHEKHLVVALNNQIQEILSNQGNRVSTRFVDKIADYFSKGQGSTKNIKTEVNKEIMFQAMENLVHSPQGKLLDYIKAPFQYNLDTDKWDFEDEMPDDLRTDESDEITTSAPPSVLASTAPSQRGMSGNIPKQGNDIDLILNALNPQKSAYGDNTQISLNRRVIAGDGDSDVMGIHGGDGSNLAQIALGSVGKFVGVQSHPQHFTHVENTRSPHKNVVESSDFFRTRAHQANEMNSATVPEGMTKFHRDANPSGRRNYYPTESLAAGDGRNDIVGADGSSRASGTINGDEVTNGVLKAVEGFLGRSADSTMNQMESNIPSPIQSGVQQLAGAADTASLASPMGRAGQTIGAMIPQPAIDAATKPLAGIADNLASRALKTIGNLGDQSTNFIQPGLE
jgi:hypothetical protein